MPFTKGGEIPAARLKRKAVRSPIYLTWELPPFDPKQDDIALFRELYDESTNPERQDEIYALITKNHMRLVIHILHKNFGDLEGMCLTYRCTIDDFYSAGSYGLLKAIRTFNYEGDIKLATYASRCIFNEIGMFIRKQRRSNTVRGKAHRSIHTPLHIDDDGNEQTLADVLHIDDISEEYCDKDMSWKVWTELERRLKVREVHILQQYMRGKVTQAELSKELNISQSYVSRIIKKIIDQAKRVYEQQMS